MNKTLKKFSLKNLSSYILFFSLVVFAIVFSLKREFISSVEEGVKLWFFCIFPALFPYFFITSILSSLSVTHKISSKLSPFTERLFNVNGTVGYAYFTSLISGYPVGAKIVSDLKENGLISEAESVRASAFCSTSSLSFTVSVIGNVMFESPLFGVFVFLSVLISSFITGLIFSFYKRNEKPLKGKTPTFKKIDNVLYESAYSSVISILVVGALITVFYLLSEILVRFNVLTFAIDFLAAFTGKEIAESIVFGLFECTRALKCLSNGGLTFFALPTASAICGFGGISVIAQSVSYLKKAKIKTVPFLLSKILSAVLNFFVSLIFSCFL